MGGIISPMSDDWDDDQYVAADYETSGEKPEYALQPWRYDQGKFWLTSLAWVWREDGVTKHAGGLNPDPLMTAEFLHWCIDNKKVIVGWNLVFDISVMLALGFKDLVNQCRFLDGMLAWRHLDIEPEYDESGRTKKRYSLKGDAMPAFLPEQVGYEEDIDYHDPDPVKRAALHAYNVKDCFFTLKITKTIYGRLKPKQRQAMWVETRCLPMVAESNLRGLLVDTIAAQELSRKQDTIAADRLAKLAPHGVTEKIVRSPTQLATLMFDKWRLPSLKVSSVDDDGMERRSTDKEVLYELALVDPRAKMLREYREALNNKTKFAEALVRSVEYNGDGRTHPLSRVFGTYTSRITVSSKQNATEVVTRQTRKGLVSRERKVGLPIGWAQHQMKRDKEFRRQIIAPDGYDMVEFDAAGQEYKWMAVASGDPTMLELCEPGEDPHSYMASRVYHENYRKFMKLVAADDKTTSTVKRPMGKVANLSLQYRTKPPRLRTVARVQYDIPMTKPESEVVWRTYQNTYTRVPDYWDRQIHETRIKGYVETFAGRRVKVVGDWNGRLGWSMGSTAINYRIQGTGGDQKYLAMSLLRDKLIEVEGYFAFDLHDGLYMFVPKSRSEKFIATVKPLLDDLPYGLYWGFIPPVPMNFDAKIGSSWGSLKAWKG